MEIYLAARTHGSLVTTGAPENSQVGIRTSSDRKLARPLEQLKYMYAKSHTAWDRMGGAGSSCPSGKLTQWPSQNGYKHFRGKERWWCGSVYL